MLLCSYPVTGTTVALRTTAQATLEKNNHILRKAHAGSAC